MSRMAQVLAMSASLKNQMSHFVSRVCSMERQMEAPKSALEMVAFNRDGMGEPSSSVAMGTKRGKKLLIAVKMIHIEAKTHPMRIHLEREMIVVAIRQVKSTSK